MREHHGRPLVKSAPAKGQSDIPLCQTQARGAQSLASGTSGICAPPENVNVIVWGLVLMVDSLT
jgi:hypothetical protein